MTEVRDKQALRRELRRRRDQLDRRDSRSAAVCARVAALPLYQAAHTIHCYLPIRSEVDTRPLINDALSRGKQVIVPVVEHGQANLGHTRLPSLEAALDMGVFGTTQPRLLDIVPTGAWDIVLVPLLAFDRAGYRLGYGKGYYDRLLTATPGIPALGIAFAAQQVAAIPHEPHDVPLASVVTEDEVIVCGSM